MQPQAPYHNQWWHQWTYKQFCLFNSIGGWDVSIIGHGYCPPGNGIDANEKFTSVRGTRKKWVVGWCGFWGGSTLPRPPTLVSRENWVKEEEDCSIGFLIGLI